MRRRTFIRTALLAGAGIGIPAVAHARAPSRIRVTRHRVPWDLARPVRIAQLTDIHVGWGTPEDVLNEAVAAVWASKPTVVALTGDYVNHSLTHVERLSRLVRALPKPCVATLGNHDYWSGASGVIEALTAGGAQVLVNDSLKLSGEGWALRLVGVDDGRTGHDKVERAFRDVERGEKPLVLTHFPMTADRIADRNDGMIIAGHTHGGQISIPGLTRALAQLAGYRYLAGWYDVGASSLYVSAGIGISIEGFRGGRGAMPEVAIYDLVPREQIASRVSTEAVFKAGRFARAEARVPNDYSAIL